MTWKKKRSVQGKYEHYSLSKKLKKENKISDQFEIMLNSLTLEELIGLKLEMAYRSAGIALFGMPLWYNMINIAREAILMYAVSACRSDRDAARLLGINREEFKQNVNLYKIRSYFEEERNGK